MVTQPANECNADLYLNGRQVCVLAGASTAIEAVVVRVREQLRVPLDWHYFGGRALVLTTAPPDRDEEIRQHVKMAMPVWLAPTEDPPR